jgi:Tfp pilus assembly protein PilF
MTRPQSGLSFEERNSLFARVQQMAHGGQYEVAKPILESIAEDLPCFDHGMAWYELAEIYEQTGEPDKARQAYLKALECEWNNVYALAYATFLWRTRQETEALSMYEEMNKRAAAGLLLLAVPVEPMIDAMKRGVPYEAFWRDRWPPVAPR